MGNSRTHNSIRNISFAMFEQIVHNVLSFVCRTVFIYTLGKTYLGFSGLFNDILTLLSLGELGVGTAILYAMYKPVAQNDYRTVAALLRLYKHVYQTIGILLTCIGLLLTPFLDYFISDIPDMPELPVIYWLYLLNTTMSYFFSYKKSVLIANQESFIASLIYTFTVSLQCIVQIICLLVYHNFILYLVIQVCCTFLYNLSVSLYVDRKYTLLKQYPSDKVKPELKNQIINNIKAMFTSKLSSAIVTSTDNLLISKYVSTIVLGVYSNYTLFTTMMRTIITKMFEGLTGSVGNLIATETNEQNIFLNFRKIWFVNYWIVAFCCTTLVALINPFIELWIGEGYLLNEQVTILICLNLYMRLIRNTFLTFIDSYGLFIQIRPKCIAEACINLVVSLLFVTKLEMGIYGILLGTFISNIVTNFWYEPYLLFKNKFRVGIQVYFKQFAAYFFVLFVGFFATFPVCNLIISESTFLWFALKSIYCVIVLNTLYFLFFHRTEEYQFFQKMLVSKVKRKR